ncbi:protein disulfide oxidoreductase [Candidatus Korarchaeum cryptofilum]|uniref:Glutaredoxin-like domain protein n=1 Tax=Korarchaeum cryptofilum (strain OPF8) TaxID=374847 RepID=B1L692_KORCO|nr:thioredoxin family protein [Candidatus Korarchaeum cryptofilum]ACB07971.1 glutaredoxin-like domain protein [Candidatus Korarchaeum cryptofilum OPF8]
MSSKGGRIIDEQTAAQLRARFESEMVRPVEILLLKGLGNEEYSEWTESLLLELGSLSDMIEVRVIDVKIDPEALEEFNVTRTPTILLDPRKGYKIRYMGAPLGYEAWAFVETIILLSRDESGLSERTKEILGSVRQFDHKDIHIMTFVTPTCPYCPYQVLLANKFAIELKGIIEADCIEAYENPDLADSYQVSAVPHNVILMREDGNEVILDTSVGSQPEEKYAMDLVRSLRSKHGK